MHCCHVPLPSFSDQKVRSEAWIRSEVASTDCNSFPPKRLTFSQQMTLSNYLLALLFPKSGSRFSLNSVSTQLWTQSLTAKDITNMQLTLGVVRNAWILLLKADSRVKVTKKSQNLKLKWLMQQAVKSLRRQDGLSYSKAKEGLAKFGSKSWLCQRLPTQAETHLPSPSSPLYTTTK